ncbi:hypothetical protein GCM10028805_15520 [Spirosoma harenae]
MIAPDIAAVRRFSRNNITKITNQTTGKVNAVYTYAYKGSGLPITLQDSNGSGPIDILTSLIDPDETDIIAQAIISVWLVLTAAHVTLF